MNSKIKVLSGSIQLKIDNCIPYYVHILHVQPPLAQAHIGTGTPKRAMKALVLTTFNTPVI